MRQLLVAALLLSSACAHGPALFARNSAPNPDAAADSLYWSALHNLDPSNKNGTFDDAISNLDAYLSAKATLKHVQEATILRSLARTAQQLSRVEAALQQQQARANAAEAKQPETRTRNEESVKEIERLKDELAKANAELERIKKRLAAPAPAKPRG